MKLPEMLDEKSAEKKDAQFPRSFLRLLRTAQQTGPSGGNETSLLSLGRIPRDGRGLTDVLMVTTTVRLYKYYISRLIPENIDSN